MTLTIYIGVIADLISITVADQSNGEIRLSGDESEARPSLTESWFVDDVGAEDRPR